MDFFNIWLFQHKTLEHDFKTSLEGLDLVHEMTGMQQLQ